MNPVEADLKGGELWLLAAVDRGAEGAWLFFFDRASYRKTA